MPYTTSTLADLVAGLAQRTDGVVFWTPEEARLAVNETLRDWNLLTGRWRRRLLLSTVAPVAGVPTVEYPLGATMTYGMRVALVSGPPLIPSSIFEFDLGRPTWRNETVTTGGDVPTRPILWAPVSLQRIAIWPATATAGVSDLLVDGVANTPVLVEDADLIDCGEEIVDLLTDYAVHVLAFKEAGPRWRATTPFFQAFLQAAAVENELLKTNQKYKRFAGLDRRRDLQPTRQSETNKLSDVAESFGKGGANTK
jgi:hypothetical protein